MTQLKSIFTKRFVISLVVVLSLLGFGVVSAFGESINCHCNQIIWEYEEGVKVGIVNSKKYVTLQSLAYTIPTYSTHPSMDGNSIIIENVNIELHLITIGGEVCVPYREFIEMIKPII